MVMAVWVLRRNQGQSTGALLSLLILNPQYSYLTFPSPKATPKPTTNIVLLVLGMVNCGVIVVGRGSGY